MYITELYYHDPVISHLIGRDCHHDQSNIKDLGQSLHLNRVVEKRDLT